MTSEQPKNLYDYIDFLDELRESGIIDCKLKSV